MEKLIKSFLSQDSSKKVGFDLNFLELMEVVLKNQQSCATNAGTTTPFFNFKKGARQEDPIYTYLFFSILRYFVLCDNNKSEYRRIRYL